MKYLASLFVSLWYALTFAQAGDCSVGKYWPSHNQDVFENEIKKVAVARTHGNLGLFCRQELAARYLRVNYNKERIQFQKNDPELQCQIITEKSQAAALDKVSLENYLSNTDDQVNSLPGLAWDWSLIPTTRSRIFTLFLGVYDSNVCRRGVAPLHASQLLKNDSETSIEKVILKSSDSLNSTVQEDCSGNLSLTQVAKLEPTYETNYTKIAGACAEMGFIFNVNDCVSAVEKIKKLYLPSTIETNSFGGMIAIGNVSLMLPKLYVKLLSSEKISNGLHHAAKLVLEHAQVIARNQPLSEKANLFDDLVAGFLRAGFTSIQAVDLTWESLAVIASTGPNLYSRLSGIQIPKVGYPAAVALSIIASTTPILDLRGQIPNRMYSFPKGIEVTCDSGKPYHFWMAAYLSRELRKTGASFEISSAAAYILQKGYQTQNFGSRKGFGILGSTPLSPSSNVVRMDLAYSTVGALFGAKSFERSQNTQAEKVISIDNAYQTLIKNAGYNEPKSGSPSDWDMLKVYPVWNNIFTPNSAFDFLKKEIQR